MRKLTESQEKAISLQKHLSVTANAGSGKTTVLIEKYVKILEEILNENPEIEDKSDIVESIVVITFTEKAASELKERATRAIEDRIHRAREENDFKKLKIYEELRDAMPSAVIGTIHSFCAKILREFAVSAGIDANFTVLEGAEREQAIDVIIENKLKEFLKRGDENSQRLFSVIERIKIADFYKLIKKLITSRELVEKVKRDIYNAKSDDEIIQMWREKISNYVLSVFKQSFMVNALRNLHGHIFPDQTDIKNQINEFEQAIEEKDVVKAYEIFMEKIVSKKIYTSDLKELRKSVENVIELKPQHIREEILTNLQHIIRVAKDIQNVKLNKFDEFIEQLRQYIKDTRLVLLLYDEINAEYERFKILNGYLDFEDLQLKVNALLDDEDVRNELSNRFKYIMIDEYQDTNYLQYEIVRKLIRDFSEKMKLFVVGDDKQSIYGFRGSDVEVFHKTSEDICKYGNGEKIMLQESFRLLRGIAEFVNRVFDKIMGERISIHEVEYNHITVGRNDDDDGKVEMLILKKENDDIEDFKLEEARFVAKKILKLLQEDDAYVYKNGERKKVEPGDIAVLIRNRDVLKPIENAFIEMNIPYIVSSGIGFYQTQEIYDFLNYLEFLVNTNDDVALVGILRSPFFGIKDSEIFRISVYGRGSSFWEKVRNYIHRSDDPKPSDDLKRAVEILEDDLRVANRMSIPSLIHRIIENTMYNGSVLPMRRGEQIVANIQKLIDIAREFEANGFNNLYDFVEQLRFLSAQHLREGQAGIEFGLNAVQILTIHSAKGLEFPVVVLPFLGEEFKKRANDKFNIDIDYGIGLGIKSKDNLLIENIHKLIKRHKVIAEEKRVLYVAMTRARDILILSGAYKNENDETYLNWILSSLGLNSKIDYIPEFEIEDSKQGKTFKVKIYRYGVDLKDKIEFIGKHFEEPKIDETKIFIKPLESRPYGEFFTATQLQAFGLCPMKFYLKFRIGLPEPKKEFVFEEEFEDIATPPYDVDFGDEILGTVKGRIVHEVLEKFKGEIDDEKLKDVISFVIQQNGISNEKKFKALEKYVFEEAKRVLSSEFGKRIFSADEYHTEYEISTKFGDGYLMGKIDRLYKANGQWEIVDFKTDDIELSEIEQRKKEYEVQLSVYSYLLSKLYPEQKIYKSYILFTRFPDKPIEIEHTNETLRDFEKWIDEAITQIKQMDLNPNVEISTKFKEHCYQCGYFSDGKCIGREI